MIPGNQRRVLPRGNYGSSLPRENCGSSEMTRFSIVGGQAMMSGLVILSTKVFFSLCILERILDPHFAFGSMPVADPAGFWVVPGLP
jgi:hypothetical protein